MDYGYGGRCDVRSVRWRGHSPRDAAIVLAPHTIPASFRLIPASLCAWVTSDWSYPRVRPSYLPLLETVYTAGLPGEGGLRLQRLGGTGLGERHKSMSAGNWARGVVLTVWRLTDGDGRDTRPRKLLPGYLEEFPVSSSRGRCWRAQFFMLERLLAGAMSPAVNKTWIPQCTAIWRALISSAQRRRTSGELQTFSKRQSKKLIAGVYPLLLYGIPDCSGQWLISSFLREA